MLNTEIKNNDSIPVPAFINDKRQHKKNSQDMWGKLNLSQQYAVCSLGQFGYLLTYVRSLAGNTLAILKQSDKVATVNAAGILNVNPGIICR